MQRLFITALAFLISVSVFGQEMIEGYSFQYSISLENPSSVFITPDAKYLIIDWGYDPEVSSVFSIEKDGFTHEDITGDLITHLAFVPTTKKWKTKNPVYKNNKLLFFSQPTLTPDCCVRTQMLDCNTGEVRELPKNYYKKEIDNNSEYIRLSKIYSGWPSVNGWQFFPPENNLSSIYMVDDRNDQVHIAARIPSNISSNNNQKINNPEINDGIANIELEHGDYYSLIISINEYQDEAITNLSDPINDGHRIQKILTENYSFDKEKSNFLTNPTRDEIFKAFYELRTKIKPRDNLLIFYAGHGHWDKNTNVGYLLPSNANKDYRSAWISVEDITNEIKQINCRNSIIISDACFSGSLLKTRDITDNFSIAIEELYKTPARRAITSGGLETVQDNSVFLEYLSKQLINNTKNYLSAEELYFKFKAAVINNSNNAQIPQYGVLPKSGDEGGDFIFIRKQ
jgi:hypothetical protein